MPLMDWKRQNVGRFVFLSVTYHQKKQHSHSFCISVESKSLRIDEGDPDGAQIGEQRRTTLRGC
jgi:hypothetical protein